VRLNLLKLLRSVVEVHPNKTILVEKYELLDVVERLSKTDGAVLVRELAREIVPTLRPVLMRPPIIHAADGASGSGSAGTSGLTPAAHKLKVRSQSIDRNIRGSPFSPPIQSGGGPGVGDQGHREKDARRGDPPRGKVFTKENSPSLRESISSNGRRVLPKLKPREDQDGKPGQELYYYSADEGGGMSATESRERERELLISRKVRRAASVASSPLQPSSSASQLPAPTMISQGRGSLDDIKGVKRPTSTPGPLIFQDEKNHSAPKEGKRPVGTRLGTFTFEKDSNDSVAISSSSTTYSTQTAELVETGAEAGMNSFNSSFGLSSFSASRFKSRIPRQKLNDVAAWLERNDGLEMD